jgi:serine/threonine protein kinase
VFKAAVHRHIVGEQDVYLTIDNSSSSVQSLEAICTTSPDIHLLYNTAVVGDLGSFTNGECQAVNFVRACAAEIVLVLEYLHRDGIICRAIEPSSIKVDRYGHLKLMNLRLAKYVAVQLNIYRQKS